MIEGVVLDIAARAIIEYLAEQLGVADALREIGARAALNRALARSSDEIARAFPDSAPSLFDAFFLTHTAVPVLARAIRSGDPDPDGLASAWDAQLGGRGPAERYAEIRTLSVQFFQVLWREIGAERELAWLADERDRRQLLQRTEPAASGFITLEQLLVSQDPRTWPRAQDFEEGLVHFPEETFRRIGSALRRGGVCLLSGPPASGKTVSAIAYLWHRSRVPLKRSFRGMYLEIRQGHLPVDARGWYRRLRRPDVEELVVVIDNAHLAPMAVEELIRQWAAQPGPSAQLIVLCAQEVGGSIWEDDDRQSYRYLVPRDAMFDLSPRDAIEGIISAYSRTYVQRQPERFQPFGVVPMAREDEQRLVQDLGENLVLARAVLERWGSQEGALTDVDIGGSLRVLAERYVTTETEAALLPLAWLQMRELAAARSFVSMLPGASVDALRSRGWIAWEEGPHGLSVRLRLHPQIARYVLEGHLQRLWGAYDQDRFDRELATQLRAYVLSEPENAGAVLVTSPTLLRDPAVEEAAVAVFGRRHEIGEAVRLTRMLGETGARTAARLLRAATASADADAFARAARDAFLDVVEAADALPGGAAPMALEAVTALDDLTDRVAAMSAANQGRWFYSSRSATSTRWRLLQRVADALDLDRLAAIIVSTDDRQYTLLIAWLGKASPDRLLQLAERLGPMEVARHFQDRQPTMVAALLRGLKEATAASGFVDGLIWELDWTRLFTQAKPFSLDDLKALLRVLPERRRWHVGRLIPTVTIQQSVSISPLPSIGVFARYYEPLLRPFWSHVVRTVLPARLREARPNHVRAFLHDVRKSPLLDAELARTCLDGVLERSDLDEWPPRCLAAMLWFARTAADAGRLAAAVQRASGALTADHVVTDLPEAAMCLKHIASAGGAPPDWLAGPELARVIGKSIDDGDAAWPELVGAAGLALGDALSLELAAGHVDIATDLALGRVASLVRDRHPYFLALHLIGLQAMARQRPSVTAPYALLDAASREAARRILQSATGNAVDEPSRRLLNRAERLLSPPD